MENTRTNSNMDTYQTFISLSRYSRWLDAEQRRETWDEVVERYLHFVFKKVSEKHKIDFNSHDHKDLWHRLKTNIGALKVLPSMRAIMMAGPALERCNVGGYNCSYLPVDHVRAFDETMYILMCGTGVGFSVERQFVSQLPIINEHIEDSSTTLIVEDTRSGWAKAFRELISLCYSGRIPSWDLSKLRPAGARLKTTGGRSSGPEPLNDLFYFTTALFRKAAGRKLSSLECHDLMCKIGEVVVVGGVRRSALISLSNLSDDRMRDAKAGEWWVKDGQRALSNNSACYTEKPDTAVFIKEWLALYQSRSGERGIFNREAAKKQVAKNGRRDPNHEFGTNPCSEIILRPYQFCNLSEVVVRAEDDLDSLLEKVELATIIGTLQSTLTDFKYLRAIWRKNTEEERLLGVSLTGIFDNINLVTHPEWMVKMREHAVNVNKYWAELLGIPQSTAVTCVKPSGTVSQLADCASGIHARYARHYIRTVRCDNKDPITKFFIDQGVPHEPDYTKPKDVTVFSFPQKAPKNGIVRKDMTAVQHLEVWKRFQENWCEHKPSVTIDVREHEWIQVQSWVWDNFDMVSGIAFLPNDDHVYRQAPYQEITEEKYNELNADIPKDIDWDLLRNYEKEDTTAGTQTLACSGGVCEVVDLVAA